MQKVMRAIVLLAVLSGTADATAARAKSHSEYSANPMRRVVTMLQMMQNKVEAEGKKALELYDKFMCYCKTTGAALGKSIAEAEDKIPQLESSIKEGKEAKTKLEGELVQHKADRADATTAIDKAQAIRNKEAKAFAKESAESNANIDALSKAIPAIEKGMEGSFLQTSAADVLRRLSVTAEGLSPTDLHMLSAFLAQSSDQADSEDSPGSGEILGILKQMKEEMEKDLAELTTQEESAAADFEAMSGAKKKEIAAATKAIEEKTVRVGELSVEIVTLENDLEDTEEALAEDKKMLADLEKNCAAKKKEWAVYQKTMAEELVALADVIKMLNDDDALELFKKTLPGASSFIQLDNSNDDVRSQALEVLNRVRSRSVNVDFITLALRHKKGGFDKVIKLIDDMVVLLGKEQVDDTKKKEYCLAEFDSSEDQEKELSGRIGDLEKIIEETEDTLGGLDEEVAALKAGILELDRSVAQATEQRKEENTEFTSKLAANNAAKELIEMAKNRLNKFYNPTLYKPPPKRELSEEERITLNMGGTLAPTNPPGGIAGTGIGFVQVRTHTQMKDSDDDADDDSAPPPAPVALVGYGKQSETSGGVIAMMDGLKADLEKEILEMEMEEKEAQSDYEKTMADAAEKRATDSKAITEKEGSRADLEESLQKNKDEKKGFDGELMEIKQYILSLHGDCDWLLENYDARKEARTNEIEAIKKAKDVLNGADYSLVQTGVTHMTRRFRRK